MENIADRLFKIGNDFWPDNKEQSGLALDEMRGAINGLAYELSAQAKPTPDLREADKYKITFEELWDKQGFPTRNSTRIITVAGKNFHGDTVIRQEEIKESLVYEALKAAINNQ